MTLVRFARVFVAMEGLMHDDSCALHTCFVVVNVKKKTIKRRIIVHAVTKVVF